LQEATDLDHLVLTEVANATRSKGDNLTVHGDGPIAIVGFVYIAKALKQHTDVVPLDVVIEWVSKDLLNGNSVVVIQLD
jgi:hypothetical protein